MTDIPTALLRYPQAIRRVKEWAANPHRYLVDIDSVWSACGFPSQRRAVGEVIANLDYLVTDPTVGRRQYYIAYRELPQLCALAGVKGRVYKDYLAAQSTGSRLIHLVQVSGGVHQIRTVAPSAEENCKIIAQAWATDIASTMLDLEYRFRLHKIEGAIGSYFLPREVVRRFPAIVVELDRINRIARCG